MAPNRSATLARGSFASSSSVRIPSRSSGSTSAATRSSSPSRSAGSGARKCRATAAERPRSRSARAPSGPCTTIGLRARVRAAAASAAKREGAAASRAGRSSARRTAPSTPSIPPCSPSRPEASKHTAPGAPGSTAAPIDSSAASTRSHASAAPAGSGGTSASLGQRAIASPSRIPARTPWTSAAGEVSPMYCARPSSGASATGLPRSSCRSPARATRREKRGRRTATIIERMFASSAAPRKGRNAR